MQREIAQPLVESESEFVIAFIVYAHVNSLFEYWIEDYGVE